MGEERRSVESIGRPTFFLNHTSCNQKIIICNVCPSSSDYDYNPNLAYYDNMCKDGYEDQSGPCRPLCSRDRKNKRKLKGLKE